MKTCGEFWKELTTGPGLPSGPGASPLRTDLLRILGPLVQPGNVCTALGGELGGSGCAGWQTPFSQFPKPWGGPSCRHGGGEGRPLTVQPHRCLWVKL